MIDINKIKEAESNVKRYLDEGLLKKTDETISLAILIKNAKESINAAKLLLDNEIPLWTIVSSYYTMFYISNAVLLKYGYKTKDKIVHKVTYDALIVLIRDKLKNKLLEDYEEVKEEALKIAQIKSDKLIKSFDYERSKRGRIQYQTPKSDIKNKAITSLNRAKEFLFEMESLL